MHRLSQYSGQSLVVSERNVDKVSEAQIDEKKERICDKYSCIPVDEIV